MILTLGPLVLYELCIFIGVIRFHSKLGILKERELNKAMLVIDGINEDISN